MRVTPFVSSLALAGATVALLAGCEKSKPAPTGAATTKSAPPAASASAPKPKADAAGPIAKKLAAYAPVAVKADLSVLPKEEKAALDEIIKASRFLDPLFDLQAYRKNPELQNKLAQDASPAGRAKFEFFRVMRGPWDRQNHHIPFAITRNHVKGAGFYPEDMKKEEFKDWIKKNSGDKKNFESLFTIINRQDKKLVAVPYSEAYATWLKPAAEHLNQAATKTKNASLKKFLKSRAKAFLSDDYYQSDKDWMDMDSLVEVTIGPYETYEDKLLNLKASFESFVTIADPKASKKLAKYKGYLGEMEKNLPVDDKVKTKRGRESPIRVVDLVFASGDARKSVQTIAFNLPNDERVRKEKGAKKVMLRNLINAKFRLILKPIAETILDKSQHKYLSQVAFFNETLFHELSHSLGPAFTKVDGKKVEVRKALGAPYSALEECKADVMGAYNILFMIKKKEFPKEFREKLLVSYFAGLFRSVRFGVAEAHGQGAAIQINRFLKDKGAVFDEKTKTFKVDFDKLEASIKGLVHDLVMIQHKGDKAEAKKLLTTVGIASAPMKSALGQVQGVPVDLRPYYPAAGESAAIFKAGLPKKP